ncbi:MAG: YbgF trimerization domain-containing protein [Methylotenera sp.]|nr:YbgF trimerization domain-containing protein [Methylotenera sp.]MDO9233863.1 YbgF trimerization domain-containing protein [Methylotenera sp.]MDO9389802.1 YbgF trimerization domain-containing protein [Methylotenera sp.]MDP2102975.1 YbgF trimerization domain-containing protein [Methylotenera sp.]MDP2282226.1 YbgF trimerization domain-containing protein [Methylotenera sp.]
MMKKLILAGLILTAQLFSISSHAALFDDTEARKKILELEKSMQSQSQASQAMQAELSRRLSALEAIVKNGLADTQAQIEVLKQENARLKGELELANHNVDATQQRQKDLYTDIDARLRQLEAAPVAVAAQPDLVAATLVTVDKNSQEYQLLELANGLSKESKHKEAFNAYDKFVKDYPNSAFAADAIYGLGYSQFALKNYKSAIATQQKLLDTHVESPLVPDAMLSMANSQIQLGLVPGAKKTLRDLIAKFPNSDVTPTAQKRLKALEAIR